MACVRNPRDRTAWQLNLVLGLTGRLARSMRAALSTRLSLAGILGLVLLSGTHWAREAISNPGAPLAFALGVLPNLAAAFAMPLILASFLPSISDASPSTSTRRRFVLLLAFTTLGLCAWELIQTLSSRFYFDLNDLAATVIGATLAFGTYSWQGKARSKASAADGGGEA